MVDKENKFEFWIQDFSQYKISLHSIVITILFFLIDVTFPFWELKSNIKP